MPAKLVRDGIPALIAASGEVAIVRAAEPEEMLTLLRAKLLEEVEEFVASDDLVELADVLEVIYALADRLGSSRDSLEQLRAEKAAARGAFGRGVVLVGMR
ncbi:nucleoside triphosphate pyrophosphohydrolase [Micromonospora sediminicola]|uniref:nucleoside triphosphate pyrophosphohydrolase n=1 Tax=Micromonospora sediminicola TaxID=946078 RepID=UPI0037B47FE3